jgi:hypothetical protein
VPFAQPLGIGLGCQNIEAMQQGAYQQALGQGIQGRLGDAYEQRFAQSAAMGLRAPGPLPGARNHDDEPDCGIPGCYVCEGKVK